jgi:hypothetical protein
LVRWAGDLNRKVESTHALTVIEQCAMVSNPIPDCEKVLSSMSKQTRLDTSVNTSVGDGLTKSQREQLEMRNLMNTLHLMAGERTE